MSGRLGAAGAGSAAVGAATGALLGELALAAASPVPAVLLSGDPEKIAAYWAALSTTEREALILVHPEVIGSTDGIPAAARDAANTLSLDRDIATLTALPALTDAQQQRLANALATKAAVESAHDRAGTYPDGSPVPAYLLLYKPGEFGGDGGVAISIGDVDTAKHVATYVPGMEHVVADNASWGVEWADDFRDAGLKMSRGESVATVFWLGYDSPSGGLGDLADSARVTGTDAADEGGSAVRRLHGWASSNPPGRRALERHRALPRIHHGLLRSGEVRDDGGRGRPRRLTGGRSSQDRRRLQRRYRARG